MTEQITSPVVDPSLHLHPLQETLQHLENSTLSRSEVLAGNTMTVNIEDSLATAENMQVGVKQELHAVIQADEALFGLVSVSSLRDNEDSSKHYILTQLGTPDARGTIVDTFDEAKPLIVGRAHQSSLGSYDGVSRNHFQVEVTDAGVVIRDMHSSNRTRVFTPERAQSLSQLGTEHGMALNGIARAMRNDVQPVVDLSWAPKTAEAAKILNQESAMQEIETALKEKVDNSYVPLHSGAKALVEAAKQLVATGDKTAAQAAKEVAVNNSLNGKEIPWLFGKWKAGDEELKAAKLLQIYKESPQTAELLVDRQIAGFHGSSSASLLNVLEHGLMSAAEARRQGILLSTGEQTFSAKSGQETISFADWRHPGTISYYSYGNAGTISPEMLRREAEKTREGAQEAQDLYGPEHPFAHNGFRTASDAEALADHLESLPQDSDEAVLLTENFPIAYGISETNYDVYNRRSEMPTNADGTRRGIVAITPSDAQGEFMVYDKSISFKDMPVIAVPSEKVAFVQELLGKRNIDGVTVVPLEVLVKREDARLAF